MDFWNNFATDDMETGETHYDMDGILRFLEALEKRIAALEATHSEMRGIASLHRRLGPNRTPALDKEALHKAMQNAARDTGDE